MSALSTTQPVNHIRVDADGSAWIEGTNYRITTIVLEHLAYGWSPAEIHFHHHRQLSMAQIHAALAYYFDHQERMDAELAAQSEEVESLRLECGETPFHRRMRTEGKLK